MIGRRVLLENPKPTRRSAVIILTVYFALVASSSPSLSQLIIGLGFPWAEQLSRVLPPSFASTYCGGVAVNEGGAVERVRVGGGGVIQVKVNILTAMFKKFTDQGRNPQLCCHCISTMTRVYTIKKQPKKTAYVHIKAVA